MNNLDVYGNLLLKRLPYGRMRKAEVAEYANRTLILVEKHNPQVLLIKPVFDLLATKQSEIDMLGLRYGVDPLRSEIKQKRSILNLNISTLKLKVQLLGKFNCNAEITLVASEVDNYLRRLYTCNNKEFMQRIQGFFNVIASDKKLGDALDKHNLLDLIEDIKLTYKHLHELIHRRIKLLSERPKIPTSFLIDSLTTSIDNLFKAIEVAHLMNPELDYEPLAGELNKLTDNFKLTISLRDAKNKRKPEEETVESESTMMGNELEIETSSELDKIDLEVDTPEVDLNIASEDESCVQMQTASTNLFKRHNPSHINVVQNEDEEEDGADNDNDAFDIELYISELTKKLVEGEGGG